MIPRSGGGGRNVNPGQADEVFAEHGVLFLAPGHAPKPRQINPHFSCNANRRALFLICARFSRTHCRPCPRSAFFLTMRENFPLFTLMAHFSECIHD